MNADEDAEESGGEKYGEKKECELKREKWGLIWKVVCETRNHLCNEIAWCE